MASVGGHLQEDLFCFLPRAFSLDLLNGEKGANRVKQPRDCPEDPERSKLSDHVRGKLTPPRMLPTDPRPTAPLTLEHMMQTHPVVEAKTTACRYWVNYVVEE
ncbi:Brachyury 2 [Sigmodon hispidus]